MIFRETNVFESLAHFLHFIMIFVHKAWLIRAWTWRWRAGVATPASWRGFPRRRPGRRPTSWRPWPPRSPGPSWWPPWRPSHGWPPRASWPPTSRRRASAAATSEWRPSATSTATSKSWGWTPWSTLDTLGAITVASEASASTIETIWRSVSRPCLQHLVHFDLLAINKAWKNKFLLILRLMFQK